MSCWVTHTQYIVHALVSLEMRLNNVLLCLAYTVLVGPNSFMGSNVSYGPFVSQHTFIGVNLNLSAV